jgi:hypothetical protein
MYEHFYFMDLQGIKQIPTGCLFLYVKVYKV